MTNLRDKLDFSYDKESHVISLKGDEYSIGSWLDVMTKFHDFEVIEDKVDTSNRLNPVEQFAKYGTTKIFTFYPDHNFIAPGKRKLKLLHKGLK